MSHERSPVRRAEAGTLSRRWLQTIRCPHRPRAPVAPEAGKPTGEKEKMSAWETYTDGEYGRAFKFPWEVEATELTTIGHAIPAAILLSFYLVPLAYGVATGRIDLSALS